MTTSVDTGSVVVGVDGSEANRAAVDWAVEEARLHRRRLVLLGVGTGNTPTTPRAENLERDFREHQVLDLLTDLQSELTGRAPEVDVQVETGEPSHALARAVQDGDVLVVGREGKGAVSRMVVGSTSIAVAGRASVPVVVVPAGWSQAGHAHHRVVAGIDGSDRDDAVLGAAFLRAFEHQAPLTVTCAWQLPALYTWSHTDIERWATSGRIQLAQAVAPWSTRYPNVEVVLDSEAVDPAHALLSDAADAQLLVLGRHTGPHHPGGLSFGSTTRRVLHRTPCPVLVVPTHSPHAATGDPAREGPR